MSRRFAIYYVPDDESMLDQFGRWWLNRDNHHVYPVAERFLPQISRERLEQILEDPRRYGFHATLKPPFRLADGCSVDQIYRDASSFAAMHPSFTCPPLKLAELGNFLALVPSESCPGVNALAAECVREFDRFRAGPTDIELERRRSSGLTANEDRLLVQWGYPYVFDAFRFHMTLTGRIDDDAERKVMLSALKPLVEHLCHALPVSAISILEQQDPHSPFFLTHRFPLQPED